MTDNKAKRQNIVYNLVRLVLFNLIVLPVFFVGEMSSPSWGSGLDARFQHSWPVYAAVAITFACLVGLSAQWNNLDRDEKRAAESEREAEAALAKGEPLTSA